MQKKLQFLGTLFLCLAVLRGQAITFVFINEGTATDSYSIQAEPDGTFLGGLSGTLPGGGSFTTSYSWANTPGDTTGFRNTDGNLMTTTDYGWNRNSDGAGFNPDCYCYTNTSDLAVITVEFGTPIAPCYTNVTWNVRNTDSVGHRYMASDPCDGIINPPGGAEVNPGDSRSFSLQCPCTNASCCSLLILTSTTWVPNPLPGEPNAGYAQPNWDNSGIPPSSETPATAPGSGPSTADPNAPSQDSPGTGQGAVGQYNPTNSTVSGTNAPIVYTVTSTNVNTISQQEGDSALYSAITKGFQQNHSDLTGVNDGVVTGLQNVVNAIQGSTNGTSTNVNYGSILSLLPGSSTNGSLALDAGTNADSLGAVGGFISSLAPTLPGGPGGPPSALSFMFMGNLLNFDPVSMFPNVANFAILGWEVMLSLWFLYDISKLFWDLVRARSAAKTGGVPNMDAAGFNVVGVATAVVAPAVVIALFAAAMIYLFSQTSAYVTAALNVSGWSAAMGDAYYLLASFFPVNFFFGIMFARIIVTSTLSQVYAGASSAARFILNGG